MREDKATAKIFIDEVEHSQDRILGPLLVGHHFWKCLNFPYILAECGFNDSQIATAELSVLNRLRARSKITWHFYIPTSPYLSSIFIRKILKIVHYSCGFAQSDQ